MARVDRSEARAHTYHHARRLRTRVYRSVFGKNSWVDFSSLLLLFSILRIDLTGLSDTDAFSLTCDFNIRIVLAANHYIFLDKLDRIVLAIRDLLRGVASKLLWVEYLVAALPSLDNLVTVLRVLIKMKL